MPSVILSEKKFKVSLPAVVRVYWVLEWVDSAKIRSESKISNYLLHTEIVCIIMLQKEVGELCVGQRKSGFVEHV